MENGENPPLPPPQIKSYDLTTEPYDGRKSGKNIPEMPRMKADERSPAAIMRAMGFNPNSTMTPLQFLVAVFNDDVDKIFRSEEKRKLTKDRGGIGMGYRVECAKTAAKYFHMEMPKVTVDETGSGFADNLQKAVLSGNERVRTRRMIIETVERISPDARLEPANYPPIYENATIREPTEGEIMVDGELLNPEGDREYNPDAD